MDHRTPARKTMDCLKTLFNGFDSKSAPWGAMDEVFEGRKVLEEIIKVYYHGIDVPAWIPAKDERVEYKNMHGDGWLEGVVHHMVVKEGLFIAYILFDDTGRLADYRLEHVRKVSTATNE